MTQSIGISRRQRVFAALESARGTLTWPVAADFVRPAGDAVMNQSLEFSDSEEKRDTLDILDQFANTLPPVDWTLPTYVRAAGLGVAPQGDALFTALQGVKNGAATAEVEGATVDESAVTIPYDPATLTGFWPEAGVFRIGTEDIAYAAIDAEADAFTGCTRGYGGTTPAAHADAAAITLKSIVYRQGTESPSFSLWVQTDHMLQYATGCTVSQGTLGIDNEGAVTLNYQGQGMRMGWAGTCVLAAAANAAQAVVAVPAAGLYSVGARVWNKTKADDNAGAGYAVIAVNDTAKTITLGTNLPVGGWAIADVIAGFLPAGDAVGKVIESRHTAITIDGVPGKFKSTDLTFNVPKQYVTDEVGTLAPEDYLEQARSIESDMKVYFRQDDVAYFKKGADGLEVPIVMTFGQTAGRKMVVSLPRCKLKVPTISFSAPAVELSMPFKALGALGEDSATIRFE
jgi:hypothetical protein